MIQPDKEQLDALFGNLAKAFSLSPEETAKALEQGHMDLDMGMDQNGNRFVLARFKDGETERTARIFKDSIHYEGEEEPDAPAAS